jgi:hypothetical protein
MKYPTVSGETAALGFAIAPLLVYVLATAILEVGGLGFAASVDAVKAAGGPKTGGLATALLAANHARVVWLTSVLVFCTVALTVLVASVLLIHASLSRAGFRIFMLVAAGLSIVGLVQFWASTATDSNLALIFHFTYDSLRATGRFVDGELSSILLLVTLVNVLAAVVPFFVIVSGCSLVTLQPARHVADIRHYLFRRMADLKTIVNLGSAMLVAGALHLLLWLRWPIAFTEQGEIQAAVGEWALSVTLYCGTAYSLMIAALYVPCSIALTKNADLALQRAMPELSEPDRVKWLEQHGFSAAPIRQIPQIIAALAPMFAGPIGAAVSGLGSPFG